MLPVYEIRDKLLHTISICQTKASLQGDHSPDTAKLPDISLTIRGTLAHVKWYS